MAGRDRNGGRIDYHGGLALPPSISCKVSSESAGYVSMAAVARVDLPVEALAAKILGVCGKDAGRVAAILARGSLVSGDSRYRWQSIKVGPEDMRALLDRFPDHDPDRKFDPALCARMIFRNARGDVEIDREAGRRKRLFRRKNFWDEALGLLSPLFPRCEEYSYSEAVDVFVADLTPDSRNAIRTLSPLLAFTRLEAEIGRLDAHAVALHAKRPERLPAN